MIRNYASIGKAIIIQAVGIQRNYSENVTIEIDKEKTGCNSCPYAEFPNAENCAVCEKRCFITEKKYINEKNKYGTKNRLKINALKMLIYFHFLHPDSNGLIKNVSIKELAQTLHCDERTVTNNIKLLQDYGYIYFSKSFSGKRNIMLVDYKSYFNKAENQGKGYIVMNKAFLEKLLEMDNIITARVHLRNLVEIDALNKDGKHGINTISKSYKQLQHELPSYCKKGIIQKSLTGKDGIYYIKHDEENGVVKFSLNEAYIGKRSRNHEINAIAKRLKAFVSDLQDAAMGYGSVEIDENNRFYNMLCEIEEPLYWHENHFNFNNLAKLADYYTCEIIEESIMIIYSQYICNNIPVESLGALVRTISEKIYAYGTNVA